MDDHLMVWRQCAGKGGCTRLFASHTNQEKPKWCPYCGRKGAVPKWPAPARDRRTRELLRGKKDGGL